jgi:hypothetical protein
MLTFESIIARLAILAMLGFIISLIVAFSSRSARWWRSTGLMALTTVICAGILVAVEMVLSRPK